MQFHKTGPERGRRMSLLLLQYGHEFSRDCSQFIMPCAVFQFDNNYYAGEQLQLTKNIIHIL